MTQGMMGTHQLALRRHRWQEGMRSLLRRLAEGQYFPTDATTAETRVGIAGQKGEKYTLDNLWSE